MTKAPCAHVLCMTVSHVQRHTDSAQVSCMTKGVMHGVSLMHDRMAALSKAVAMSLQGS